jgi:hypothetical protein
MSPCIVKGMVMQVSELEELSARLHRLRERLETAPMSRNNPLTQDSPLVQAAKECEFMLPERLTLDSLSDTVDRKIKNVAVLLERARRHEDLPESAQAAAEQEDLISEEETMLSKREHGKPDESHMRREL